ncbi:MAG: hypothetical protein KGJ68_02180 [Gammaproteobacteria bacterium]|nr:hypothetical protein [Gammaproteobacteria bacterium]
MGPVQRRLLLLRPEPLKGIRANDLRVGLAALGAFVAYMAAGGFMFVAMPLLKTEFARYPAVYRYHDGQMSHFPVGMAPILLAIVVLAVLYAKISTSARGSPRSWRWPISSSGVSRASRSA